MNGNLPMLSVTRPQATRIHALDTLRGLTIVSMIAFHTVYDLVYLYGVDIPWFRDVGIQSLWRISISWVFLALAGWMTAFSRDNLRRAAIYSLVACGIWAVTSIAHVDTPISFGIMFCMAASTWIWAFLDRGKLRQLLERHPVPCALLLLTAFFALYRVPYQRYEVPMLAWLGFPDAGFSSGDYYPLIPFGLLYLGAAVLSQAWKARGRSYPDWMKRDWCPVLTRIGTLSLPLYIVHQGVILIVLELFMRS